MDRETLGNYGKLSTGELAQMELEAKAKSIADDVLNDDEKLSVQNTTAEPERDER